MAQTDLPPVKGTSALVLFIDRDDGKGRKAYYVRRLWDHPAVPGPCWRLTLTDGSAYEAAMTEHGPECNCADANYRDRECKHAKALAAHGLLRRGE
jgi:hypothetical protein